MDEKKKKLYESLKSKGLYTKTYEEFETQFSSPEKQDKLYGVLNQKGLYTKTSDDFKTQFFATPKKAEAVSTESPSDSAQQSSTSVTSEETETEPSSESSQTSQYPEVETTDREEIIVPDADLEITALYDQYKQAGQITLPQQKEIAQQLDAEAKGDRPWYEDINAYATGFLNTGFAIPIYKYANEKELMYERSQKNKVDFLNALPQEKVDELNAYAVNRTTELDRQNLNILAENEILGEKGKSLVKDLLEMKRAIETANKEGKTVTQEGYDMYEEAYEELKGIERAYNANVDLVESGMEDIGDFTEEIDLLKRNYEGLENFKENVRLSTADMIGGLMDYGVTIAELDPNSAFKQGQIYGAKQFTKEFRETVAKQREEIRPLLQVSDIESGDDLGRWLSEQFATQIPVVTVLATTGGTTGLTILGASSGGQKIGQMRDSNEEGKTDYNTFEMFMAGTGYGLAEAGGEYFTRGIISKGKRSLTAARNGGTIDQVKGGFTRYLAQPFQSGGSESLAEFGTQVSQNLIDIALGEDKHVFDNVEDAIASGGALGVGLRLMPTAIGDGLRYVTPRATQEKMIRNAKTLQELSTALEQNEGQLSEESIKILRDRMVKVSEDSSNTMKEVVEKAESMTPEQTKELIELEKENNNIIKEVNSLEQSNVPDNIKEQLKDQYKKRSNEIAEKKAEILNGSKQEAQTATETETDIQPAQEAVPAEAQEEGANEGAEGSNSVQGKVTEESSGVVDGDGVQSDSVGAEGVNDGRTVETVREELAVAEDNYQTYVEGLKDGVTEDMTREQKSDFMREKDKASKLRNNLQNELDKLEESQSEKLGTDVANEINEIDLSDKLGITKGMAALDKLDDMLTQAGKENLSVGIPIAVAQAAVKAMKAAMQGAKVGADVLSAGLNSIQASDWYKGLTRSQKADVVDNYMEYIGNPNKDIAEPTQRESIETNVEQQISEGATEQDIIDSFETKKEKDLAQDVLARRVPADGKEALNKARKSYAKAKKETRAKKSSSFFKKGMRGIAKKFWDRQYLPKMILMKAGGKVVRNFIITAKGAPGYAKYQFEKAYNKIYKGLSDADIEMLDLIILQRRFIAIDNNREDRGLEPILHPDFQNRATSQEALNELKNEIGAEKYNNLDKRATAYFDAFKSLLDQMQESGIVTKEFRDNFFDVDYQPRVFLQFLTDQEQEMSIVEMGAPESQSLGAEQIRRLEEGSAESLIVDSMYLLGRSMNTRASSIAMNNMVNRLVEFMDDQAQVVEKLKKKKKPKVHELKFGKKKVTSKYKEWLNERKAIKYFEMLQEKVKPNPIIGFTESGNPKYKNKPKFAEKTQVYYKDGVKHQIIMEEAFYDQLNDNLKGWFKNSNAREKVALASLSGLVKGIATGNNPAFFITNSPRDFMFIATFSEEYGAFVPKNLLQIAKDTTLGLRDMGAFNNISSLIEKVVPERLKDKVSKRLKETATYEEFVKHGGMLDYLHKQGEFKGTTGIRKIIDNAFDNRTKEIGKKIGNTLTLNKLQTYSEIGFRMGVFRRSVKNQMKQLGLKDMADATDRQREDIYTNAAASARNTTDFSQGGIYTKDADAMIPYLNAGVQGTRVAVENLNERPVETMLRMAQSATMLSAIPIGLSLLLLSGGDDEEDADLTPTERYFKAMERVSQYDKTNYQIIFTGNKDEDGEYEFMRVSKPHFLTPLITYAQSLQENFMRERIGLEPESPVDNMLFAVEKNISPVEMSVTGNAAKNPILKAALTYTTGYDFYRNQDLSYLRGDVPEPVEGHESKSVEDFYKQVGEDLMISPARMKGAVESIITTPSTSPFVGVLYGGLDIMSGDKEGAEVMEDLKKTVLRSVTGRIVKNTSEYNTRTDWDEKFEREFATREIKILRDKQLIKDLARKTTKGEVGMEEVTEAFTKIAKEDSFDFKRLMNTYKEVMKSPKKDVNVIDLQFRSPYERAIILYDIFGGDLLTEKKDISKKNKKLKEELFTNKVLNKETMIKYLQLLEGKIEEGSD